MIEGNGYALIPGNCLDVLRDYPDGSFASIVCDPPYGINMADWDKNLPEPAVWAELLRVAAPGAFLLAFGGTQTFHRLACSIEDAGWCYFDTLGWIFGGGMPKSRNRLKPAWNPIVLACKGLDALQIEACRVPPTGESRPRIDEASQENCNEGVAGFRMKPGVRGGAPSGRWPANILHDGSPEVVGLFPESAGQAAPLESRSSDKFRNAFGAFQGTDEGFQPHDALGSASRFFYCARASASERGGKDNTCAAVKPLELMKYLVRLVTPPEGCVLDPFLGSGSTGLAALEGGFSFVGIDNDPTQFEIARKRLAEANP